MSAAGKIAGMKLGAFRDWLKRVGQVLRGREGLDDAAFEALEETLLAADVNVHVVERLLGRLREESHARRLESLDALRECLRQQLLALLGPAVPLRVSPTPPTVYLFIGVNGVGKTTTIAKCAHWLTRQGKRVLLAAADTFRAAAIDQLQIWAERLGVDLVKQRDGADPSAVAFDAIQAARARGIEYVLVDTAGRQHTRTQLMEELKKIYRVTEKAKGGAPEEVLLILDAVAGQNSIRQAEEFHKALPLTGAVVAKLDSTARGGAVFSVREQLGIPIKLIGVGEQAEDLRLFDPEAFVEQLLGDATA